MILLVEDDLHHVELIRRVFGERGSEFDLRVVGTISEAQAHLSDPDLQLVLADFLLPDGTAVELLPGDMSAAEFPTVIMTSHGNEQVAVDAMKAGALDYVVKSEATFQDMPHLISSALREWDRIVEQRDLENQLREAQKLEALGTLAGGIAHDFNNLLMGIQGNASLLLLEEEQDGRRFERLKSIETLVKSGAALTQQLLGFARGGKHENAPVEINNLVKESAELFGRTRKQIRIHLRFQNDEEWINGDRVQLEQILINLYVNAWQAMPRGGDLYLQTESVELGEKEVSIFGGAAGEFARIVVADNGVGMDSNTQTRIFEPFFSTKGTGSGLGLASAHGIVKNHGGYICAESIPSEGSSFEILLPASNNRVGRNDAIDQEKIFHGNETVLIVDDEPEVLKVSIDLLGRLGYNVLAASSGNDARELFALHGKEIDLVILDVIMPDIGAPAMFAELQAIEPDVLVLLCSGYGTDNVTDSMLGDGCVGFIQKPFTLETISAQIRSVFDHSKFR